MVEFTGERVVPGQVNADLWNEHFARYAFARRYAHAKRILDAGSGTGYGTAELAQTARWAVGVDLAPEAAAYAQATYPLPNLRFTAGSCAALPFADGSFDLVVAFEVIEHLRDYRAFLTETRRVLAPGGFLIVSTPNKKYYAESRAQTGPNPYHEHEFEPEEFVGELSSVFATVCLALQNRVESFAFYPPKSFWPVEAALESGRGSAEDSHFLVALCSNGALPEPRSFVYVPRAVNILREREQHIELLEQQLDRNKAWLEEARRERDQLLEMFRAQKVELDQRTGWAQQLNLQLEESFQRTQDLQTELAREQAAAVEMAAAYESKLREAEQENVAKTHWALDTEARLMGEVAERTAQLGEASRLLEEAERTVEERTRWAQEVDARAAHLGAQLSLVRASRWIRLGNRLHVGPVIQEP